MASIKKTQADWPSKVNAPWILSHSLKEIIKTVHIYNCTCKLPVKISLKHFPKSNRTDRSKLFLLLCPSTRTRHLMAEGCNYASSKDTLRSSFYTTGGWPRNIISNDPIYQVSYKIFALHISYVYTFREITRHTFLYMEAFLAKNKSYMHYRGVISLP